VVVRDAQGNPLSGQTVSLSATGGGVSLSQPPATDGSGTATATLSATAAGDHVVTAVTAGVTLGSATVKVNADAPAVSRTTVQVPNGTAGVRTDIQVTLQDQFGNLVGGASSQLSISVSGANTAGPLPVNAQPGGVYVAGYTPVVSGTDQVDVRLGGTPVPGSPFASTVAPGAPDPKKSTADVPSDGQILVSMTITVRVNDSQGNLVGHGGDQVMITPEHYLPLTVSDHGDGIYTASWTPLTRDSNASVIITLNGTPIAGSPFKSRIRSF
jgi:adhesin/invasin